MAARVPNLRKFWVFIALTFLISSGSYSWMITSGSARDVVLFWMWSPGLSAITTQLFFKDNLRDFGWKPGPIKYLILAAVIPIVYSIAIYGIVWITSLAGFRKPSPHLFIAILPGLFFACITALGEEIGWRGFLVPYLFKNWNFTRAVLVSWIIWAVWHFPAIIWADYHSNATRLFDITSLTLTIFGLSSMTAWMRLKSGSIWPPVLWHGMHNILIQGVFLSMTIETEISEYLVDDFGLGVMFTSVLLGLFFLWRARNDEEMTKLLDAQSS